MNDLESKYVFYSLARDSMKSRDHQTQPYHSHRNKLIDFLWKIGGTLEISIKLYHIPESAHWGFSWYQLITFLRTKYLSLRLRLSPSVCLCARVCVYMYVYVRVFERICRENAFCFLSLSLSLLIKGEWWSIVISYL